MKLLIIVSVSLIFAVKCDGTENCDKLGILLYEDMACKPTYDKNNSCPVKFDCLGLMKSNNNCYFKGRTYRIDEQIDSKLTASSCNLGCFCEKEDDTAKFECAILDCPEWSGQNTKPQCYRKYSLDACCSVREVCPPYDSSVKCVYNGIEYKEGENFLPADSCWRCICQEGFKGKIEEPFCRRRVCGIQTKYQEKLQSRCAPLYYRKPYRENDPFCCPNKWICSEGNENITGRPKSDKKCYFGQKTLRPGQGFTKNISVYKRNITITCDCNIPPLLTCTTII